MSGAGYGRRTLLHQALDPDAIRLRLRARHRDVDVWRRDLLLALTWHDPEDAAVDAPDCDRLLHALAEARQGWLVLEDVDAHVHGDLLDDIQRILIDCPRDRRVALTTRTDLGATVADVRLAERLVEIDQPLLAFTEGESLSLLTRLAPELEPAIAGKVAILCDGWAAALKLAIRQAEITPAGDLVSWLRTRGAELLIGPWFDALAPHAQELLLDVAFLDELKPGVVDAVVPGAGAAAELARMARDRGPLWPARTPGGSGTSAYTYKRHPLLTELLRRQAVGRPGTTQRHIRAAEWYRRDGDLANELENLFAAGRRAEAAERLFAHEEELLAAGRAESALRWYGLVGHTPEEVEHLLRVGWASALSGNITAAHGALGSLQRIITGTPIESRPVVPSYLQLEGEIAVLEAWLAFHQGDVLRTADAATRARQRFADKLFRNSHQLAALLLARSDTILGHLDEADRVLEPLRAHAFAVSSIGEGLRSGVEAELAWARGDVFACRAWAARRNRWLHDSSPHRPPGERPALAHWLAEAESGRIASAIVALRDALIDVDSRSGTSEAVMTYVALAHVEHLARDTRSSLEHLHAARSLVRLRSPSGGLLGPIQLAEARIRLLSGDALRAERLLRVGPRTDDALILYARLNLLRGGALGVQLLREVSPTTPRLQAEHALLSAWAQLPTSRQRAEQHLIRSADVAAANGLRTILVDAPPALIELAASTASHFVHDGLQELVTMAQRLRQGPELPASTAGSADSRTTRPLNTGTVLGRGDLQLVALLPTRLTYAEIAVRLGVSVNTVKTRLRRLYVKLNVHDRRSAVDRSTALGLLARADHAEGTTPA
jgi:LuxR family maltose regulon positive regulatory protein